MLKTRIARVATSAMLAAGFAASMSSGTVVNAAPPANSDNVTICHRTASVTNPYVRITVDQRSVGNANSKHGGGVHDHWATSVYTTKPSPNVFNPDKTYPANDKKWGDIIAFTDVSGNQLQGNAYQVRGLNNTGIGADIFNGVGRYAGLCRTMNARDYYEVQKSAGLTPQAILEEMNELDSPDFATQLAACGGTFTGCDPAKLGTTSISIPPAEATTTVPAGTATTIAGSTGTTVPGAVTLAAGKGGLTVKTWIDKNRNGKQAGSEKNLKNITVKIVGPNGVTKTGKTAEDGTVTFTDLDPGQWSVVSSLSIDGYEKVYDSDGTVNWKSTETVVEGQVAAASFAAATKASASSSGSLPATGNASSGLAIWAAAMLLLGTVVMGLRQRHRA